VFWMTNENECCCDGDGARKTSPLGTRADFDSILGGVLLFMSVFTVWQYCLIPFLGFLADSVTFQKILDWELENVLFNLNSSLYTYTTRNKLMNLPLWALIKLSSGHISRFRPGPFIGKFVAR